MPKAETAQTMATHMANLSTYGSALDTQRRRADLLEAWERQIRAETIERCAAVAEREAKRLREEYGHLGAEKIAPLIRALKPEGGGNG